MIQPGVGLPLSGCHPGTVTILIRRKILFLDTLNSFFLSKSAAFWVGSSTPSDFSTADRAMTNCISGAVTVVFVDPVRNRVNVLLKSDLPIADLQRPPMKAVKKPLPLQTLLSRAGDIRYDFDCGVARVAL